MALSDDFLSFGASVKSTEEPTTDGSAKAATTQDQDWITYLPSFTWSELDVLSNVPAYNADSKNSKRATSDASVVSESKSEATELRNNVSSKRISERQPAKQRYKIKPVIHEESLEEEDVGTQAQTARQKISRSRGNRGSRKRNPKGKKNELKRYLKRRLRQLLSEHASKDSPEDLQNEIERLEKTAESSMKAGRKKQIEKEVKLSSPTLFSFLNLSWWTTKAAPTEAPEVKVVENSLSRNVTGDADKILAKRSFESYEITREMDQIQANRSLDAPIANSPQQESSEVAVDEDKDAIVAQRSSEMLDINYISEIRESVKNATNESLLDGVSKETEKGMNDDLNEILNSLAQKMHSEMKRLDAYANDEIDSEIDKFAAGLIAEEEEEQEIDEVSAVEENSQVRWAKFMSQLKVSSGKSQSPKTDSFEMIQLEQNAMTNLDELFTRKSFKTCKEDAAKTQEENVSVGKKRCEEERQIVDNIARDENIREPSLCTASHSPQASVPSSHLLGSSISSTPVNNKLLPVQAALDESSQETCDSEFKNSHKYTYTLRRPISILSSDLFSKNAFQNETCSKDKGSLVQNEMNRLRLAQADLFAKTRELTQGGLSYD